MALKNRKCIHCETLFENIDGKIFANHVRWCDKNLKNGDKGRSSLSKSVNKFYLGKIGEIKDYDVNCGKCNKLFIVKERETKFPSKDKYFCSRSCANSRGKRTEETKNKISKSLSGKKCSRKSKRLKKITICKECQKSFEQFTFSKKEFCDKDCKKLHIRSLKSEFQQYKIKTCFCFNLSDYTDEFDFGLIENFGWYSPKNSRKPNLNGVSRDHMYSVKEGFRNNVEPSLLAHPANCKLMRHNDNVSKLDKCSISLEELRIRIKDWDKKYNYGVSCTKAGETHLRCVWEDSISSRSTSLING